MELERYYSMNRKNSLGREVERRILLGTFLLARNSFQSRYQKAQRVSIVPLPMYYTLLTPTYLPALPTSSNIFFQIRRLVLNDFKQVFSANNNSNSDSTNRGVHFILTPTTPSPAPSWKNVHNVGNSQQQHSHHGATAATTTTRSLDPVEMYLNDVMTVPASLAGLPSISLPIPITMHPSCNSSSRPASQPNGLQLIAPKMHDYRLLRLAQIFESYLQKNDHHH